MPRVTRPSVAVESNGIPAAAPINRFRCAGQDEDISLLNEDPVNARLHPEKNMEAIKASLVEFGQMSPITVREQNMTVMKGNGTLRAAKLLGWTKIRCSIIPMTDLEAIGYGIADNRAGELAEWDEETRQMLVRRLEEAGLGIPGYTSGELDAILMEDFSGRDVDPDTIPPPPLVSVVALDDVWTLGKHRLMCGDSLNVEDVRTLMGDKKARLLITDPPYGVDFKRGQTISDPRRKSKHADNGGVPSGIVGDSRKAQDQADFITAVFNVAENVCQPGSTVYMFSASMQEGCYSMIGLTAANVHLQSQLIWNKGHMVLGQADYQWRHEVIWYGWWEGASHRWFGGRAQTTVLDCKKLAATYHPNEKPIELLVTMIQNSSVEGDLCYEPFSGSGTMLVAAQQTGRRCYAMEIDPLYAHVSLQRWCDFAGQDAIRESDGASFRQLQALAAAANGA